MPDTGNERFTIAIKSCIIISRVYLRFIRSVLGRIIVLPLAVLLTFPMWRNIFHPVRRYK